MFHKKNFDSISSSTEISSENLRMLRDFENRNDVEIPKSVKEFYETSRCYELLKDYSNSDHPIEISEFELLHFDKERVGIKILVENQGVCDWLVEINEKENPEVYVNVDDLGWRLHCSSFSDFIFTRFWDYNYKEKFVLDLQSTSPIPNELLNKFQDEYSEMPKTLNWPGKEQLRFKTNEEEITLWIDESQTDWLIKSKNQKSIIQLIEKVNPYLLEVDRIDKNEISFEVN